MTNTAPDKEYAISLKFSALSGAQEEECGYSNRLESALGEVGRHPTSNIEAFSRMPWSRQSRELLLRQWDKIIEIPEIPGGYYLTRAVDQAFLRTVNNSRNIGEIT